MCWTLQTPTGRAGTGELSASKNYIICSNVTGRFVFCFCRVLVSGPGPSARYAHTLSLVANRFLVAMGGNDGKSTLGDAWALDTSEKPYAWRKITDAGEMPSPRYDYVVGSLALHTFA